MLHHFFDKGITVVAILRIFTELFRALGNRFYYRASIPVVFPNSFSFLFGIPVLRTNLDKPLLIYGVGLANDQFHQDASGMLTVLLMASHAERRVPSILLYVVLERTVEFAGFIPGCFFDVNLSFKI
jgi:hypothetical protein